MRVLLMAVVTVTWATLTFAQEKVRLAINFIPGGTATRIITGKVKGEWTGPTKESPDKPVTISFDLSVRASSYITVSHVTAEGDGVILIQPQGGEAKGTVSDQPFEFIITYNGDVKLSWGALSFDSTKLPEEERAKMRKLLTSSLELTLSPQGKIKGVKPPEALKEVLPQEAIEALSKVVPNVMLRGLLPVPFPAEPVAVGKSWQMGLPIPIFESETPTLPIVCTLKGIVGDEAVITVQTEAKGDADLTFRRPSPEAPAVTIKSGELKVTGELFFLLSMGIPQRASWKIIGEAKGIITPPKKDASPLPFSARWSMELRDELSF